MTGVQTCALPILPPVVIVILFLGVVVTLILSDIGYLVTPGVTIMIPSISLDVMLNTVSVTLTSKR